MTEIQTTYSYKHLAASKSSSLPGQNQEALLLCNTINVRRHDSLTEPHRTKPQNQVIYSGTLCFERVASRTRHFKATYRVFARSCEVGHIYMTDKATWKNSATSDIYSTPYQAAAALVEKWGGQ
jgi:hypothetical protein